MHRGDVVERRGEHRPSVDGMHRVASPVAEARRHLGRLRPSPDDDPPDGVVDDRPERAGRGERHRRTLRFVDLELALTDRRRRRETEPTDAARSAPLRQAPGAIALAHTPLFGQRAASGPDRHVAGGVAPEQWLGRVQQLTTFGDGRHGAGDDRQGAGDTGRHQQEGVSMLHAPRRSKGRFGCRSRVTPAGRAQRSTSARRTRRARGRGRGRSAKRRSSRALGRHVRLGGALRRARARPPCRRSWRRPRRLRSRSERRTRRRWPAGGSWRCRTRRRREPRP